MAEFTRNATQMFFQNSLAEVIRKLRASSKQNDDEAIEQFIKDTKSEVSSTVQSVKVIAIQKAAYFHMLGYNASYANFNVVEVMADTIFANKRAAYVAACNTFAEDTDVIPLMTALLKKDLNSSNPYEVGLALYCISSVCTPHLAKDVVVDVVHLLSHPRIYIRKKAILCLYKLFLQYPECLRPTYPKLKEKLEDGSEHADLDASVRGAVVCVLCELARRNPSNFLGLAVPFYSLLSSVHSNWTLIKIIKVFGYFAPLEPRLGKKLTEPLVKLITTSSAKSVQFECMLAVANGMSTVHSLSKLTAERLNSFITDNDQNLKYLGLEAMTKLAASSAKLLMDQRESIMSCLRDSDVTIRCKALYLLRDVASRKTLISTVNYILDQCTRGPLQQQQEEEVWLNAVVETIIEMAQTDDYALVEDFEWYMGVLINLALLDLSNSYVHGSLVEQEIVTILVRVNGVRPYAIAHLIKLLTHNKFRRVQNNFLSTQWKVLCAVAFACGEYPHWIPNKSSVLRGLLDSSWTEWPVELQKECIIAAGKVAGFLFHPSTRHVDLHNGEEEAKVPEDHITYEEVQRIICPSCEMNVDSKGNNNNIINSENNDKNVERSSDISMAACHTNSLLYPFCHSPHPEVQECASVVYAQVMRKPELGEKMYGEELLPIAANAQELIAVPDDLDLNSPFCENIAGLMAIDDVAFDQHHRHRTDHAPHKRKQRQHTHDGNGHGKEGDNTNNADSMESENSSDDDYEDDDNSSLSEDDNFDLEYRIAQQKELERERRAQMSAFYLRNTELTSNANQSNVKNERETDQAEYNEIGKEEHLHLNDRHHNVTGKVGKTGKRAKRFAINRNLQLPSSVATTSVDESSTTIAATSNDNNNDKEDLSSSTKENAEKFSANKQEDIRHAHRHNKLVNSNHKGAHGTLNEKDKISLARNALGKSTKQQQHDHRNKKLITRHHQHQQEWEHEEEVDEATRKLRNIDVTRALSADEKLPEPKAYPRVLVKSNMEDHAALPAYLRHNYENNFMNNNNAAERNSSNNLVVSVLPITNDTNEAMQTIPPVTLHKHHPLRVILHVVECKFHKNGIVLQCTLQLTNISRYALHDVHLYMHGDDNDIVANHINKAVQENTTLKEVKQSESVATDNITTNNNNVTDPHDDNISEDKNNTENVTQQTVNATKEDVKTDILTEFDNLVALESDKADDMESDGSLRLVKTLKRDSESKTITILIRLRQMPSSLATPLPLMLRFVKKKNTMPAIGQDHDNVTSTTTAVIAAKATDYRSISLPFQLRYVYFSKVITEYVDTNYFNNTIVAHALNGTLVQTSDIVICDKTNVIAIITKVKNELRLQVVDVFKDAMTLYGLLHGRKSTPYRIHVAVLLTWSESEAESAKGVKIAVKSHYTALSEALLSDLTTLFATVTKNTSKSM